jgi:hypothetical protein
MLARASVLTAHGVVTLLKAFRCAEVLPMIPIKILSISTPLLPASSVA